MKTSKGKLATAATILIGITGLGLQSAGLLGSPPRVASMTASANSQPILKYTVEVDTDKYHSDQDGIVRVDGKHRGKRATLVVSQPRTVKFVTIIDGATIVIDGGTNTMGNP